MSIAVIDVEAIANSTQTENRQYLGCTTNVEDGISNTVTCLFENRGLFAINKHGEYLWSYQDPVVASQVANISSVPLLLPYNTTIVDTGTHIMAFSDGIFDWQEVVANLSDPGNTVSSWSAGFVDPQYFSITLGDGRISLYDYSMGMCWAAEMLTFAHQQYLPISVTSSIDTNIYVLATSKNDTYARSQCAIFAFEIGNVQYRLQTRWTYVYGCNLEIGFLGLSAIPYLSNETATFPVGTLIMYSLNDDNETELMAVRDERERSSQWLWSTRVNEYCGMGYLVDPRDTQYGLSGVWICDYYQSDTLLLKRINVTNGQLLLSMNVNEMVLNAFSVADNWKNVFSVNISSRGVSGFTSDLQHYVVAVCVDVVYTKDGTTEETDNVLIIVDIEEAYLLSWFIFESDNKCTGQLSATTDGKIVVPAADGMTVFALSV